MSDQEYMTKKLEVAWAIVEKFGVIGYLASKENDKVKVAVQIAETVKKVLAAI